ncbi:MAG: cytochrome c [Nitrospirae bacterium]|nr:cytochrome c [Nitrospirota bacterium]MBI3391677.1 cytochrome c [Nitrospirota bacterium]
MTTKSFVSAVVLAFLVVVPSALAGPGQAGHEHDHGAMHGEGHDAQMKALLKKVPAKAQKAKNPVRDTPEGQAKAKELYAKSCAVCHGEGGKGDGPAAAGLPVKPADFTDAEHQKIYTEGTMYWIVTNGWKESGMPGFAKTIPRDDRWRLVRHVLGFSAGAPPAETAKPGAEKGGTSP